MSFNIVNLIPELILTGTLIMGMLWELILDKKGKKHLPNLIFAGIALALAGTFYLHGQSGFSFNGMFQIDPLASLFKILFGGTALFVIIMAKRYFESQGITSSEYYLTVLITLIGFFFLASANDFLLLFVSLEIVTLSFYILAAYTKKNLMSIEAGLKYLILGSLASAFIIYGISLVYVATASTSFPVVKEAFFREPLNTLMLLGIVLMVAGICFKIAAVPFQFWVADVYEGAPTPTVSYLSVASKAAGFMILLRTLFYVFGPFEDQAVALFSILAILTIIYGNFCALVQTNIKRLFGYSSIGHAGYLLIGIAAGRVYGPTAVLFYLVTYAVSTLAVFYCITLASHELQSDDIEAYSGLGKRSPFLAGSLFLALLSSAGIPPLAGFTGKFFVFLAGIKGGQAGLVLLGALGVIVSLFYYLNLVRVMYFEDSTSRQEALPMSVGTRSILTLFAVAIITLGVYHGPILIACQKASLALS